MKSRTVWEDEAELVNPTSPESDSGPITPQNKIDHLKKLTYRLLREMESIAEVQTLNIESGLDFYDEVSRFEVDLIMRALLHTGGHQVRAARLLNLKVTTLNSKIKHYNIELEGFAHGYPFVDTAEMTSRQHA